MTTDGPDLALLGRALDQAADLLGAVGDDDLARPTPCTDWTVGDLVDHLVHTPVVFATLLRGDQPDWTARPPHVGADRVARFGAGGDALLDLWASGTAGGSSPVDWQLAELSVHAWDLATALGRTTSALDPEVAERGLAFMRQGLTTDNRGAAFAAERPAPPDADAYTRIAAFAGREV